MPWITSFERPWLIDQWEEATSLKQVFLLFLSILVRLSTEKELHQNGHDWRWYEVRQISPICLQLDIFGEFSSPISIFFSSFCSFSLSESFNFACSSLNIQFHFDIIVHTVCHLGPIFLCHLKKIRVKVM